MLSHIKYSWWLRFTHFYSSFLSFIDLDMFLLWCCSCLGPILKEIYTHPEVSPLCHQYCRKQLMRHLLSLMSSQTSKHLTDGLVTSSSVSLCLERQLIETKIYSPVFLKSRCCDCVSDITGQRKWLCVCTCVIFPSCCLKLLEACPQPVTCCCPPTPLFVFSLSALLFCISLCLCLIEE